MLLSSDTSFEAHEWAILELLSFRTLSREQKTEKIPSIQNLTNTSHANESEKKIKDLAGKMFRP